MLLSTAKRITVELFLSMANRITALQRNFFQIRIFTILVSKYYGFPIGYLLGRVVGSRFPSTHHILILVFTDDSKEGLFTAHVHCLVKYLWDQG